LDKWAWTYQLDPLEVGTRLTMRLSDPGGDAWSEIGDEMSARVAEQSRQLENLLQDV
jgi:hypothetical protein